MAIANLKQELEELTKLFFLKKRKEAGGTGSGSEDEFRALMNEETQEFKLSTEDLKKEVKLRAPKASEKDLNSFATEVLNKGIEYFNSRPKTKNVKFEVTKISNGILVLVKAVDPSFRGTTGKRTDLFKALQKFKSDEVNKIAEKYPNIFGKKEEGNIFTKTATNKSGVKNTYWNILDIGHEDAVAAGKAASVRGTLGAADNEIGDIKRELIREFQQVVESPNSLELEHFQDIIDSGGKLKLTDSFVVKSSLEDSVKNQVEKGGKLEAKIGSDLSSFLSNAIKKLEEKYNDPKETASRKRSASINELGLQMIINNHTMRGYYKTKLAKNLTGIKQTPKSKKKVKVGDQEKLRKKKTVLSGFVLTNKIPLQNRKQTRDGGDNELLRKAVETRAFINSRLTGQIQRNMGRPALINQSGRFAQSASVVNAIGKPNGIHMDYTYNPLYRVFEEGEGGYPVTYDPRRLIEKSIRELAIQKVEAKFTLRRI